MSIHVGTSGFYYEHWRGLFYPESLAKSHFFEFYMKHFDTVELNSTFYHLPRLKTTEHWAQMSPEAFLFSLKAYRGITHYRKLSDVKEELYRYLHLVKPLKPKLASILFQLPPSLHLDLPLLRDFLEILPSGYRYTVEFRHASWLTDDVFNLLKSYNVALCINDFGKRETPFEMTADFGYIRFHGPTGRYGGSYDDATLSMWAERLKEASRTLKDIFVYFNNDFGGFAVQNAKTLKQML
ncbi:DUF72 domain-containing protein [Hydrogenimonas cancrithermarum]|uniref:DUF72 domain-containing protein n=1 Tax=Hydrogenimonas cancrithermarum TaxID=2993563 RepID=A0ABM8FKC2_9BACT|nr:DUF72 domain-containing protein [Hydrogenimonas cancrithermarum]BDY12113.1 hypothetical protein HCR_04250 [Hydrogenimonas cancrithermarum]